MYGYLLTHLLCYGGALVAIFNPFVGVCLYWAFDIVRPQYMFSWSGTSGPFSLIIATATLVGWGAKGFGSWRLGKGWFIFALLVMSSVWTLLSTIAAPNKEVANAYLLWDLKRLLMFTVAITTATTVPRLMAMATVLVASAGYVAFELNLQYLRGYNEAQFNGYGGMDNNEQVLTLNYWSEIGIDELYKGASLLVKSFLDDLEKLKFNVANLKTQLKKNTSLITYNLSRGVSEIVFEIDKTQNLYKNFINDFLNNKPSETETIYDSIENATKLTKNLVFNLQKEITVNHLILSSEEESLSSDMLGQFLPSYSKLIEITLPEVEKMIELVTPTRQFADRLAVGTLRELETIDEKIKTRAEHWRIERMAIVDRNVLRLAVCEFLYEETPHTVIINEALEIARRFSTFEATQFINGILDAIKHDLEKTDKTEEAEKPSEQNSPETNGKTRASTAQAE